MKYNLTLLIDPVTTKTDIQPKPITIDGMCETVRWTLMLRSIGIPAVRLELAPTAVEVVDRWSRGMIDGKYIVGEIRKRLVAANL